MFRRFLQYSVAHTTPTSFLPESLTAVAGGLAACTQTRVSYASRGSDDEAAATHSNTSTGSVTAVATAAAAVATSSGSTTTTASICHLPRAPSASRACEFSSTGHISVKDCHTPKEAVQPPLPSSTAPQQEQQQQSTVVSVESIAEADTGKEASDQDLARPVSIVEGEEIVTAFSAFAKSVDGCSTDEFYTGVQESYYSLASLLDVLSSNVQPLLGKTDAAKFKSAVEKATQLLKKEFQTEKEVENQVAADTVTSSTSAAEVDASTVSSAKAAQDATEIQKGMATITSILPISQQFSESIIRAWILQKESRANLFTIASPSDYVLSSELSLFMRFDTSHVFVNSENVHGTFEVEWPRKDHTEVQPSMQKPAMQEPNTVRKSATQPGFARITRQTGAPAAAEVTNTSSTIVKVNGVPLPPIPADARACAILTMDVVVPPERFVPNYQWFYRRIVGYENDYERIAVARVFAANSPKSLVTSLDFVVRMITGKPVELLFSKAIGRMVGIPEDVSKTPPASRKLVCMYMNASCQWVMSDMYPIASVIGQKLPESAQMKTDN